MTVALILIRNQIYFDISCNQRYSWSLSVWTLNKHLIISSDLHISVSHNFSFIFQCSCESIETEWRESSVWLWTCSDKRRSNALRHFIISYTDNHPEPHWWIWILTAVQNKSSSAVLVRYRTEVTDVHDFSSSTFTSFIRRLQRLHHSTSDSVFLIVQIAEWFEFRHY